MKLKKYEKLDEIDSYFDDIKKYKHLTKTEEKELAERIKQGDEKALNKAVELLNGYKYQTTYDLYQTDVDVMQHGTVGKYQAT